MPFESVQEAEALGFPTMIDNIRLTIPQLNYLAGAFEVYEIIGMPEEDAFINAIQLFRTRYTTDVSGNTYVRRQSFTDDNENPTMKNVKRAEIGDVLRKNDGMRIITKVVYVPGRADRDNETFSKRELTLGFLRQAMRKAEQLPSETGLNHVGDPVDGILVIEDYQLLSDTKFKNLFLPEGTWVRTYHFTEKVRDIWEDVDKGVYKGVSIQGDWNIDEGRGNAS